MNKEEFVILTDAIKTYFPRDNTFPTKESISLWYEELKDLDYKMAMMELRKYVSLNRFAPTIADIRECLIDFGGKQIPNAAEAWNIVLNALKAVCQEGCARKHFEALPDSVQKSVGGYSQFLQWANDGFNRDVAKSNFMKCYTEEAAREREIMKLNPDVCRIATRENKAIESK